uniref:G-protein coupled receptors family 1 profile domain-containing protein n=1 Tax=Sinocyclocheilus anshuiensis TaxID=1608454 RepID=A0A671LMN9_9TELE
ALHRQLPAGAKTTFVVMYVIIFALALVGHSLVVYIVVRKRAMRTATNIFICSLAVSDLSTCCFVISPITNADMVLRLCGKRQYKSL